jgi:prepilin peptidase CpaA
MRGLAPLVVLTVVLVSAVYSDLRRHRIPNELNALAIIAGLTLQCIASGLHGLTFGLLGAGIGLACFAPFYLLHAMGAGDVKLLAAVGVFLGPMGALYAALATLLAGGIGAVAYVIWRVLRASLSTLAHEGLAAVSASAFVAARLARRDRLPFALPIALGGIAVCWYQCEIAGFTGWLQGMHA